MAQLLIWFVMTAGLNIPGFIQPLDLREMPCGKPGAIVGVQVDRTVNPTTALWPDPQVVGQHCELDISAKVAELGAGEYHLATTEIPRTRNFITNDPGESYIGIDPHTSVTWIRDTTLMPRPSHLRTTPPW